VGAVVCVPTDSDVQPQGPTPCLATGHLALSNIIAFIADVKSKALPDQGFVVCADKGMTWFQL
jgi:hypothetical protein